MLVPILLSLFWALCSTHLIQPWFWRNIFIRKDIWGNEENIGYIQANIGSNLLDIIFKQVWLFCFVFSMSLIAYLKLGFSWGYGSCVPLVLTLVANIILLKNIWTAFRKIKYCVLSIVCVLLIILTIIDFSISSMPTEPPEPQISEVSFSDEIERVIPEFKLTSIVPIEELRIHFKADSCSIPISYSENVSF